MLAGASLAAPAILLGTRRAAAAGSVNITAYDGFVPQAVQTHFEAATGTQVRIRLAASQAPELSLLTTERDHPLTDICTVVGARLHQFVDAGIIEPLDTARLKNWSRINPIYADAGAYEGVYMFAAAIKAGKIDAATPVPEARTRIRDYLATLKDFPGLGNTIDINKDGDAIKKTIVFATQGGAWVRQ